MHGNIINLKGERFGSLTVLGLTDLKTPSKRGTVWECRCDCGNICYKTSGDLRDKRRKTVSCGCHNKGGRKFPNKFVSKTDNSLEASIINLSKKYGSIDLITAAIMRNNNLSYEMAREIAERLNSSDYLFDRFIEEIIDAE